MQYDLLECFRTQKGRREKRFLVQCLEIICAELDIIESRPDPDDVPILPKCPESRVYVGAQLVLNYGTRWEGGRSLDNAGR